MDTLSLPMPQDCSLDSSGTAFLALSSILFTVATIVVPLRVYTRIRLVRIFWWDDICLVLAYILLVPSLAVLWREYAFGWGRPFGCKPVADALQLGYFAWIATTLLIFTVVLGRISVALFVIRLFAITQMLRRILYGFTIFMTVSLVITAGLTWGECTPIQAIWNPTIKDATCWSKTATDFVNYYNGAVSIFSDISLALLPAYFIKRLKLRTGMRIALVSLMAVGLVPAACALARTIESSHVIQSTDVTESGVTLSIFGMLEATFIVVTAAIPGLPPLFQKEKRVISSRAFYYKNLLSRSFGAYGSNRSPNGSNASASQSKRVDQTDEYAMQTYKSSSMSRNSASAQGGESPPSLPDTRTMPEGSS